MDLFDLPAHAITFEHFWKGWPNKVDRGPSEREWKKAMRAGVRPEDIIDGRDHYVKHKPKFQSWMHGRTFLHVASRRWENRYPVAANEISAALDEVFK